MRVENIILKQVGPFDDVAIGLPEGKDPNLADVYLLTGPNGSGKSTVLYALAACLWECQHALGMDLVTRRLRSKDAIAAFSTGDDQRAVAWYKCGNANRNQLNNPFGGEDLVCRNAHGATGYYAASPDTALGNYPRLAGGFDLKTPAEARPRFAWAAFAYAGVRQLEDGDVSAIREPSLSPFANSLSFVSTADTSQLANWIANQQFKRLKAKEAGRTERATQLAQSIQDIESVVSKIIEADFAFETAEDDNNVRVRWAGRVIDMGLLPDGLKSIVSWIADLLMRLDRIPWEGDVPPMKRSFLLLLDEVDIHLHPSWQRKVLPIVQRMFPKAQIIASTHSPFVVASAADAQILTLAVKDGVSTLESTNSSQIGVSYSAVLRSIFGITSEFDTETEALFRQFHEAKQRLLSSHAPDRTAFDGLVGQLAQRSEEVRELIAVELRQLERQLAKPPVQ